ncbi:MAG: FprA family A-type flavoprotein, partial [Desulfurococcaceae archaeon]
MNNVITTKIARDLYLVRTIDRQTKYFEGMWEIPEGVTYNSYVLTTSSGAVVFDTVKPLFTDLYLDALSKITDFK